jgi:hypothetical protein
MKTKLTALLLLVALTFVLASCSFVDKITGMFGGDDTTTAATTTEAPTVTTTVPSIDDPLRTEPAKVTTAAPQPSAPADPWTPVFK